MSNIRCICRAALAAALLSGSIGVALAQNQTTTPVEIAAIGTGWYQDQFLVYIVGSVAANMKAGNNCPNSDGYFASMDFGGYKTHLSTVQLAFALAKPITVTVSNLDKDCIDGRPRIIGVTVAK